MLSSYCYSFLLVHDEIIGLSIEKHELSGITMKSISFVCQYLCWFIYTTASQGDFLLSGGWHNYKMESARVEVFKLFHCWEVKKLTFVKQLFWKKKKNLNQVLIKFNLMNNV